MLRHSRRRFWVVFVLAWLGAVISTLADAEVGLVVFALVGSVAWLAGIDDEVRRGSAAASSMDPTARGYGRQAVARAIVLSWLVPGLGQMYLREFVIGLVMVVPFAFVWIAGNFVVGSAWVMVPAALALWAGSQIHVRDLLGIGWDPLLPSLGELFDAR